MTAVTKAGTNQYHGSAYWYFRDDAFDARNFFDTSEKPPLRRQQYGASVGGPIRPDKVFFFANYEGIRGNLSSTLRSTTITAEARSGILPGPNGPTEVPVAASVKPYLDLFPLPNGLDFGDGTAEFITQGRTSSREDFAAGRIDVLWTERLRSSFRYTFDDADQSFPDPFLIWDLAATSQFQLLHTDTQFVQSSNTLHNLRIGFSHVGNDEEANVRSGVPGSELAFLPGRSLGAIEVTGTSPLGIELMRTRPRVQITNDMQLNYEGSHLVGNHAIRFGGGYDRIAFDQRADISLNGRYSFTSLEAFLRGQANLADAMTLEGTTSRNWLQHRGYGFVQGEFRPASRLSLTLGVRYEGYTSPSEVNGQVATLRDPLTDSTTTVGGPYFRNPSKKNFAPRVAFAWDIFGKGSTVLRGGAGVFYDLLGIRETLIGGVRLPPFFRRAFIFRPQFPDLAAAIAATTPSASVDTFTFEPHQPYVIQVQTEIQQRLDRNTVLTVGYAGSRGIHLIGQYGDINLAVPEVLSDGTLFFPEGAPLRNPNFTRIGLRDTAFDSIYHSLVASLNRRLSHGVRFQFGYTWGKLIDNASSTIFQDFTNSGAMPNPFNLRSERGRGDFDVRHSFTGNFSWLPKSHMHGPIGHLVNDWEIHFLVRAQTGYPFSPTVGFDRARSGSNFGDLGQRPDLAAGAGDAVLGDPYQYFNPTAFNLPAAGFYGNLGRNALDGPGMFSADLALHKSIYRSEGQDIRFRLETFNLTNHTNLALPTGLELFSEGGDRVGSAGRITSTATPSRRIQLALRWTF